MAPPPAGLAVIDVSRYLRAAGSATEGEELEKVAAALRGACETIGFYYLTGFDSVLPRDVCRRALAAARSAHALDETVKEEWHLDDADSGFMPRGATTRWGSLGRPPLPIYEGSVEAVLLWGHGPPWASRHLREFDENQMPPPSAAASGGLDRGAWIADVRRYYEGVRRLAEALMPIYAVALGMEKSFFAAGQFDEPCWCIRMNCYEPPPAGAAASIGIAPHADGSLITLLLTDDQPGLSVQRADGEWLHISALPDGEREFAMIINSGNSLNRLSNGVWPSTMHSASSYFETTRYSIPFFWSPGVDVTIEPLPPWITADRQARFPARASGKVESSGTLGLTAKKDPLRSDGRADTFDPSAAARSFASDLDRRARAGGM